MIRLVTLKIENYRSIISTPLEIEFDDLNVIVGPNNCGKSNILRSLNLFFTDEVEGHSFDPQIDYPKSDSLSPKVQTKITLTMKYQPSKEVLIKRALNELEKESDQLRLGDNLIRLRVSYSKNGTTSWQFLGKKGARNIKRELIHKVRDAARQAIIFKYIPVGRDSLESITTEISTELIKTIFSGWSGAIKKRQDINSHIVKLLGLLKPELQTTSGAVTKEIRQVFSEISNLELRLPFSNLEEMLPSLSLVIKDSAETGLLAKGAGIQTSSLLFLLKYLADNHPQRHNARVTYIWAVEEPESFLHPTKQRSMADMMMGFSKEVQTIVTTHCAHFVPRGNKGTQVFVVDKNNREPWSTEIVGRDFELARQTLGVTLLDSMALYPVNFIVEGPSDEIYFSGAMKKLQDDIGIQVFDVKFFPAGNAMSATYLYESVRSFSHEETVVKLIIDGDSAGIKALDSLLGRSKRDNITLKANKDYFQLPVDVENLLSEKVKRLLGDQYSSKVQITEDISGSIKSFKVLRDKKKIAQHAIELSEEGDLIEFKVLFDRISKALVIA